MSEREPNPEVKPLKDKCNRCSKKYQLTEETARGVIYRRQPDCQFIATCCPHCRFQTKIFIPQSSNSIDVAAANGVPIDVLEYASDDIYDMFLQVYGIELIQPVELPPEVDEHITKIGRFLQEVVVTVEDFA